MKWEFGRISRRSKILMDWNCVLTAEERLSDYLDGLLSPTEAAAFSAHAAGCEPCGKLVAQVGGLVGSMQRLEPLDAPPQLVTNLLDATLGPRTPKQSWSRWFTWIPSVMAAALHHGGRYRRRHFADRPWSDRVLAADN